MAAILPQKTVVVGSSGRQQPSSCARFAPLLPPRLQPHAGRANEQRARCIVPQAFAPSFGAPRGSLDPLASSWQSSEWTPGRLLTVTSPEQFDDLVAAYPDKLIVLMCKSHSCRPCKMFTRKYMAIAERFSECILCELYGDETPETRKMMIRLQVKVTPTFRMYRQRECVNVVTGTNDKKLMRGILSQLFPAELVNHEREIADTLSMDEEEQQVAAAAAR
eukprot:GHUV01001192.1.p2 GENE.GHUV01001192.1~~GHUV01001192.1.p2  ORF type:complete len:220 (+),score=40.27 GHUV01001192.1:113-772(+)